MPMILPDVNVLAYAFHAASPNHAAYHAWLTDAVNAPTPVGLSDLTATGFLRIVTNRRIYDRPATIADASAFVDAIASAPPTRWIGATTATWNQFATLVADDPQIRANLVPDAWLAALAITHGARLASADRGMARYPGLDWFDPVA
jgi:toxin-antitoxin system PIN domain toxin